MDHMTPKNNKQNCDVTGLLPYAGNKPSAADVTKDAEEEGWSLFSGVAGMHCQAAYLLCRCWPCLHARHCLVICPLLCPAWV